MDCKIGKVKLFKKHVSIRNESNNNFNSTSN